MPLRIHAKTSYGGLGKGAVLAKVRAIAAKAPGDALVQRTLAEVEYDNRNFDQAGAAADAALTADPTSTEAMLYKGRSLLGKARKANDAALFKEARNWFVKANKADKEDPEPLYLYYRSYRDANMAAPQGALDALKYAAILAPRDFRVQVELTRELLRQNKLAEAKEAIKPLAYLPHAGQGKQNDALMVLRQIEANNATEALRLIDKDAPDFEDDYPSKI